MTLVEKNRLIGVAFMVIGFFHLATLILMLVGFSVTYPYMVKTSDVVGAALKTAEANQSMVDDTLVAPTTMGGINPAMGGPNPTMMGGANPSPTPSENKALNDARRTITMVYVITGVEIAILLFILFVGYMITNVKAGARSLGIAASLFMLFFAPLGTIAAILAIWFFIGDECMELYSEVEKNKGAPSIL